LRGNLDLIKVIRRKEKQDVLARKEGERKKKPAAHGRQLEPIRSFHFGYAVKRLEKKSRGRQFEKELDSQSGQSSTNHPVLKGGQGRSGGSGPDGGNKSKISGTTKRREGGRGKGSGLRDDREPHPVLRTEEKGAGELRMLLARRENSSEKGRGRGGPTGRGKGLGSFNWKGD